LKATKGEKVEGVVPDYVITSLPQLLKIEGLGAQDRVLKKLIR